MTSEDHDSTSDYTRIAKVEAAIKFTYIFNVHFVIPWEGQIWGTDQLTPAKAGTNLPTPERTTGLVSPEHVEFFPGSNPVHYTMAPVKWSHLLYSFILQVDIKTKSQTSISVQTPHVQRGVYCEHEQLIVIYFYNQTNTISNT